MGYIQGDLSAMSLTDLLQWIDLSRKTGTLIVRRLDIEKKIYIEVGKIIFISSNKEGERLGEYLHNGSFLEASKIKSALLQSQSMKIHFTQRLIDLNFFTADQLRDIITKHAKAILVDAIGWIDGTFEYLHEDLPSYVSRGTVSLNASELIYEVFQQFESMNLGFESRT